MTKLKHCPFCGEEDYLITEIHSHMPKCYYEGWVECQNCGASGQVEYGNCSIDEMEELVWFGWNERSKKNDKGN